MKYSDKMERVDVAEIAAGIRKDPAEVVARAEAAYHEQISVLCDAIEKDHLHIILVTGPSASGKTTTAKKIAVEMLRRGELVNRISLDNFYKSVAELPKWEDGYQNYESVEGLDIDCFEAFMENLLQNGVAQMPIFDFTVGRRRSDRTIELNFDDHTYLIIEGIHALNPLLTDPLLPHRMIKVYISVHSDFVDPNGETLLSARDLRLTRRMLRDFYYRGTSAIGTLEMWDYVLRGEDLYIRPFRRYADFHFNSTHGYEPFLYHDPLAALLAQSDKSKHSEFAEALDRLAAAEPSFFGINSGLIPKNSLIREFIKED